MRKLRRSIARAKMLKAGIQHMNKKVKVLHDKDRSYFSLHWREYV